MEANLMPELFEVIIIVIVEVGPPGVIVGKENTQEK
jgi:hypothetical protein